MPNNIVENTEQFYSLILHVSNDSQFLAVKGPVTRCNFSCNLQCNSTLERCKIGKYMFPSQFADIFLTYQTFASNLHLL